MPLVPAWVRARLNGLAATRVTAVATPALAKAQTLLNGQAVTAATALPATSGSTLPPAPVKARALLDGPAATAAVTAATAATAAVTTSCSTVPLALAKTRTILDDPAAIAAMAATAAVTVAATAAATGAAQTPQQCHPPRRSRYLRARMEDSKASPRRRKHSRCSRLC